MVKDDKIRTIDQSKAKLAAYIVVAAFMAIMLVFGIRSANQTALHDGDERASIPCKWCEGTGEISGERCRYCLGAKKIKAIIPGPNHPLRIRGTVWDLSHFSSPEAAQKTAQESDYKKVLLKAQPGTVGQAKILFKNSEQEVIFDSKVSGRYWGFIPPGEYTVSVEQPGFKTYQESYTVPIRQHPVWPERPGVEIEDEDQLTYEIFLRPSP